MLRHLYYLPGVEPVRASEQEPTDVYCMLNDDGIVEFHLPDTVILWDVVQ